MMRNDEPSDSDLVTCARLGDREAFGLLYDRYARLVRAVALGEEASRRDAGDVTQETFLRAYRNLSKLRRPERFGAWVVGIARQVARERWRARRRDRLRFIGNEPIEVGFEPGVAGAVQTAEEVDLMMRRLGELPERERIAVHAFFLDGCDAGRTAAILRLSRSGIYALLARALTRLAADVRGDSEED